MSFRDKVTVVRWFSRKQNKRIDRPIFEDDDYSPKIGEDGMCDKHRMSWSGKAYPYGCPDCFKKWYIEKGII